MSAGNLLALLAGLFLIGVGAIVWVTRRNDNVENSIEFFGFRVRTNTPPIAVMALGIVLFLVGLRPQDTGGTDKSPSSPPSTAPTSSVQPPTPPSASTSPMPAPPPLPQKEFTKCLEDKPCPEEEPYCSPMETDDMDEKRKKYDARCRLYTKDNKLAFKQYVIVGVKPYCKIETQYEGNVYCPQPQPQSNMPVTKCPIELPCPEREPYCSPISNGDLDYKQAVYEGRCRLFAKDQGLFFDDYHITRTAPFCGVSRIIHGATACPPPN